MSCIIIPLHLNTHDEQWQYWGLTVNVNQTFVTTKTQQGAFSLLTEVIHF